MPLASPMRYVLVNPFSGGTRRGAPSGVDAYSRLAARVIARHADVHVVDNPRGLDRWRFQEHVAAEVARFPAHDTVVEAPETRAPSLLLPREYWVHVRLHCPSVLGQYLDGVRLSGAAFEEERRAIRQAQLVTAPSVALAREVAVVAPGTCIVVYPHPAPPWRTALDAQDRDIDALFLGRNQRLKGADYLPEIVRRLPASFRVVIAGTGTARLRFGRTVRCQLVQLDDLRGDARLAWVERARVVMLPSRFESFSMVLGEALSCQTPVVAWDRGAPAELAGPPLVRAVPLGDVAAFATAVEHAAREGPSAGACRELLEGWDAAFERAIEWVLARRAGGALPELAPGHGHVGEHPGLAPSAPFMQELLESRGMPSPTDLFRFRRKLRKLRRDPRAFLRDSKVPLVGRLVELAAGGRGSEPPEPRRLGTIVVRGDAVHLTRIPRKVAEPDLATVVFVPRGPEHYADRPFLGEMLANQEFVGFRDRYLFAFDFELQNRFRSVESRPELFAACPTWAQRPLSGIRNVVFLDPPNVLPWVVRATHHDIRLVVCATDAGAQLELLRRLGGEIDVLVAERALLQRGGLSARRVMEVDHSLEFVSVLRTLIIEHKSKEKDALLPVFGQAELVDQIDALNDRVLDGVIRLDSACPTNGRCLEDLIRDMVPRTRWVLLRESWFHRYQDYCARGNLEGLLRATLEEGCRYEVIV